jgi:hypothetical protein
MAKTKTEGQTMKYHFSDGGPASVSAAAARDWDNPDASSAMAERGRAMAMSAQVGLRT